MKPRHSEFRQKILQPIQEELEETTWLLADQLASEQHESAQKLESKGVYKERLQHEIKSSIDSFQKTMHIGVIKLFNALSEIAAHQPSLMTEEVRKDITQLASLPKHAQKSIEKIKLGTQEGKTFQEMFGISQATVEAFYQAAKHLYEHGHYEDAECAFQVLTFINDKEPLFWLALGNSEYFCHHYEQALIAYALACHIDPFDPTCHLYSCKCYEELGQIDNAINALELALIAIQDDPTQSQLTAQIGDAKKQLEQKLK